MYNQWNLIRDYLQLIINYFAPFKTKLDKLGDQANFVNMMDQSVVYSKYNTTKLQRCVNQKNKMKIYAPIPLSSNYQLLLVNICLQNIF